MHLRRWRHLGRWWLCAVACVSTAAATVSVVAVAASSPVVGSSGPALLDASPDCHAGAHDYGTAEDVALASLLVCSDDDGDALSYAVDTAPAHGAVTINADGTFTYTPALDYNGPDTFDFTASDGASSDVGTATVDVTAVNDPPIANPNAMSTAEDSGSVVTPNVLENDTTGGGPDEAGQKLAVTAFTQPAHGTVADNGDGTFTYTPAADFNGTDSFTYDVTDDGASDGAPDPKTSTGTVTITVTPVNDAPAAENDAYAADKNIALSVNAANGVLNNDSDIDGDTLTAALVSGPGHGTLTLNANGSFTYTPAAGYSGADSFTYTANDGELDSNVATVSLAVTNAKPVAVDDAYSANQDTTVNVDAAHGVLANDTDADGDTLTATKLTNPSHGTLTFNANGSFSYVPAAGFVGVDSFTYKANDGLADSGPATVSINVAHVNHKPVAVSQSVSTNEDTAKAVVLGASDVDGDSLTLSIVNGPGHGTLSGSGANRTYTPNANFNGSDSFTFKANDGSLDSNAATVSLTVTPVNDAPVANNDGSYAVTGSTPLMVAAPGVLANDSDPDGDALTAKKTSNPAHGSVTLNANGSFTYTPAHDYVGPDSFAYFANDGTSDSTNAAIVTLNVSDPPKFALTVIRSGTGTGIVTSSPVGINCGADCTETYTKDTRVTLTAAPASNAAFAGWTGGCTGTALACVVTIDGVKNVTAVFVKQHWDLNVTKAGVGDGVVASVPAGIDCGPTCGRSYDDGTVVTLTATPNPSSEFEKWTGACSGSSDVCTITISGSANVVANFRAKKAPPPKVGSTVVGGPISGKVTYKRPGSNSFVLLTGPVQFPNGTIVNTKEGRAGIASAEGNGKTDVSQIWGGTVRINVLVFPALKLFGVHAKTLYGTQFTLVEKLHCATAGLQATKKRKLWGSGKGMFRTKGRYSSATVRGTKWYVEDRCGGTLTKVAKGSAAVQDFVRHKLVLVKAGHRYFASAKAPKKAKRR